MVLERKDDFRLPTAFKCIKHLDFTMDHEHIMEGCAKVIAWVFPEWNLKEVKFSHQTQGLTNKLVKCTWRSHSVLIRTYGKGTDSLIDRNQEMLNFVALSRNGLSSEVYGRFNNGFAYGYVGAPLSASDLKHPEKYLLIARHLAKWHKVDASDIMEPKSRLFETYNEWLNSLPETFTRPEVDAEVRSFITIERLRKELRHLEAELTNVDSPVVLSHGDVNPFNIIYDKERGKVDCECSLATRVDCPFILTLMRHNIIVIDVEYGFYRPRGFDLGNHFCEHAGFDCEWENYPEPDMQRAFIRAYLEAQQEGPVTEEDISKLYAEANKFSLASNLGWGIWGLAQAESSDLDFDHVGYAKSRLDEYFRRKESFLAL
ncbi:kinase-like domain-containing protein [Chytriomyces sp. MP71]|nr:kinase-like domain-containing protein [Chytriomyces sp. MP71]